MTEMTFYEVLQFAALFTLSIAVSLRLLLWVGIIRIRADGTIHWPVRLAPWWIWKRWKYIRGQVQCSGWLYLFRNRSGIIKWEKGRLLPRRWGIGLCGLIEFGDRG